MCGRPQLRHVPFYYELDEPNTLFNRWRVQYFMDYFCDRGDEYKFAASEQEAARIAQEIMETYQWYEDPLPSYEEWRKEYYDEYDF